MGLSRLRIESNTVSDPGKHRVFVSFRQRVGITELSSSLCLEDFIQLQHQQQQQKKNHTHPKPFLFPFSLSLTLHGLHAVICYALYSAYSLINEVTIFPLHVLVKKVPSVSRFKMEMKVMPHDISRVNLKRRFLSAQMKLVWWVDVTFTRPRLPSEPRCVSHFALYDCHWRILHQWGLNSLFPKAQQVTGTYQSQQHGRYNKHSKEKHQVSSTLYVADQAEDNLWHEFISSPDTYCSNALFHSRNQWMMYQRQRFPIFITHLTWLFNYHAHRNGYSIDVCLNFSV